MAKTLLFIKSQEKLKFTRCKFGNKKFNDLVMRESTCYIAFGKCLFGNAILSQGNKSYK